jgi:hypothetical protein
MHKFIFVHIPKTAGRSIEKYLLNFDSIRERQPHHSITEYIKRVRNFNSMFKFSFVRNPFERLLSEYFYIRKMKGCKCKSSFDSEYNTFKKFVISNAMEKCSFENHSSLQIEMANPKYMNFIGRFENLQEDFNTVCDKIGIPHQELQHKNKTKHKHYTEYYDDETRSIVAEKYAKDIEYFGYEFGE